MKRSINISLLAVLVGLTAATTSVSVAWYANASFLQIDQINITLSSSSKLLIGTETKKESYKEELKYEDLKASGLFQPVSSMLSGEWMAKKDKYPTFYQSYNSNATQIIETESNVYALPLETKAKEGFYSQELFLYSENDYYAMIDVDNTYLIANKQANYKKAEELVKTKGEKTFEEYYQELNKIADSIRFSVLIDTPTTYDYKIIDPNKNQTTMLGGLLDTAVKGTYDCAGLGEHRVETVYGEVNDRSLIKYFDTPQEPAFKSNATWFDSGHDSTAKHVDFASSKQNGFDVKVEDALSLTEYKARKEKLLNRTATKEEIKSLLMIPVKTMVPTRIVMSIYFEGWDIDNINNTMAAAFDSHITFDVVDFNII